VRYVTLAIWFVFACLTTSKFARADEDPQLAVWEAMFDEYLQKTDFHCEFTLKEGNAISQEAALKGDFQRVDRQIQGFLTRNNNKIHANLDYGKPPVILNDKFAKEFSWDEMTDGKITVKSQSRFGNPADKIMVYKILDSNNANIPSDSRFPHPLCLFGGEPRNILKIHCPKCDPTEVVTRKVLREAKGIVEIEFIHVSEGRARKLIQIDSTLDPIVIRSIVTTGEENGRITGTSACQASELVKIGLVHIPKLIRTAFANEKGEAFLVREWRATVMRLPLESDFLIQVPAGRKISGFRAPHDSSKPTTLDLNKLTPELLVDPAAIDAALQQRPNQVTERIIWFWMPIVVAVISVCGFAYWWLRRRSYDF